MQDELISRQAAIDAFEKFIHELGIEDEPYNYGEMALSVQNVPSVNPQQKTGHWEKMVEVYDLQQNRMLVPYGYDDAKFGNTPVYVCDCGCESNKNSRFCPDCGTKMIEPKESEAKCKNCEYYRNPDYTRCHECKAGK